MLKTLILMLFFSLLLVMSPARAAGTFTLGDYAEAKRANDMQSVMMLRSYILGAVETHLHYSSLLKNWTSVNVLCTWNGNLNMDELGEIFEGKIMTLRRRYGEDIMGMPIAKAVPMIVEDEYRCF